MIRPLVDYEVWAKRYRLSLAPRRCINCDYEGVPSEPFAMGVWRGLRVPEHECGPDYAITTMRDITDNGEWAQLVRNALEAANECKKR